MLLALWASAAAAAPVAPLVNISSGQLRGKFSSDGKAASFLDVPFATAERFTPPKPPPSWSGIRDAQEYGPGCMQHHPGSNPDVPVNQTEDCTRLNVFAPVDAFTPGAVKKYPVMVWWHGGAYKEGSSFGPFDLYDGRNLSSAYGVIVVTCNYRLDVFGALVHDGGIDGNFGFLDQRACLEWVRDEIGHFGGDATSVTAWGQSAGAQSVFLHMASPGSKGLFHRAILESAPDLSLFDAKEAARMGRAFAKELGCKNRTDAETIACMKAASAADVVHAADKTQSNFFSIVETLSLKHPTSSFLPFKPNIDGTVLPENPLQALLEGRAPAAVPALIGFNHDEMWALLDSLPSWVKNLEVQAALAILFGLGTATRAWEHYKGLGDDLSIVSKVLTDYMFTCSSQALAAALPDPTFVYQFNHLDSFGPSLFGKFNLAQCEHRACHMAEIPFIFGNTGPASFNVSFTPAEEALRARLMGAFTNFAKAGDAGWVAFNASARGGLRINQTAVEGPLGAAGQVCPEVWDKTGYYH